MANERGDPLEGGAVAGTGGNGHHGCGGDAADEAGQGPLHSGHRHHGVGVGQLVGGGQQTVDSRHPAVGQEHRAETRAVRVARTSWATGRLRGAGGDHQGAGGTHRRRSPRDGDSSTAHPVDSGGRTGDRPLPPRMVGGDQLDLHGVGPGQDDRPVAVGQQFPDDGGALVRRLALSVDRLGQALTEGAMVVDPGESEIGEGQAAESVHGLVRRECPRADIGEQALESRFVHDVHYPAWVWPRTHPRTPLPAGRRGIGFLGPEGTFTEEALLAEPDYRSAEIVPLGSLVEVLDSVRDGRIDLGFVPLENAIEGTVRDIIDSLIFDFDLRIQRSRCSTSTST